MGVLPEAHLARHGRETPGAEELDGARFEVWRVATARAAQPGKGGGIASVQFAQQLFPDDWKLVHMLMPVDEGGRAAHGGFESIELGHDFAANRVPVQRVKQAAGDDPGNAACLAPQRVFGQVQVQADIHASGICRPEAGRPWVPGGRAHHAADGMHPMHLDQMERCLANAFVQTIVVDHDAQRAAAAMLVGTMPSISRFTRHRPISARKGRVAWFLIVGTAAAAVHWGVVVLLVRHGGWRPLMANVVGWLVAFMVSFSGHHRLTFRDHGGSIGSSAARFFLVSAGGFTINEVAYALLMHWSGLRYDLLLAGVLVAVAGLTYLLSRHWVFLRSPAP
jgi:putative flippase GtrA